MPLFHVPEEGTIVISASFTDDLGVAVVPNAGLTWTLTDSHGNVVNGRAEVAIASAATVTIVLTGADLTLGLPLVGTGRALLIEGTYNSSLGSNLNIKQQYEFVIDDLTGET